MSVKMQSFTCLSSANGEVERAFNIINIIFGTVLWIQNKFS